MGTPLLITVPHENKHTPGYYKETSQATRLSGKENRMKKNEPGGNDEGNSFFSPITYYRRSVGHNRTSLYLALNSCSADPCRRVT